MILTGKMLPEVVNVFARIRDAQHPEYPLICLEILDVGRTIVPFSRLKGNSG